MSSEKLNTNMPSPCQVWTHTKGVPTAVMSKGKWGLGVAYYRRMSDKKATTRKCTWSAEFSSECGSGGLYDSKALAEKDVSFFRMAVDLSMCEDFVNEVSALAKLVQDRGQILKTSPKGHPELAGTCVFYHTPCCLL
jgi:hypothetical protein